MGYQACPAAAACCRTTESQSSDRGRAANTFTVIAKQYLSHSPGSQLSFAAASYDRDCHKRIAFGVNNGLKIPHFVG
jgi:hypothetical protein